MAFIDLKKKNHVCIQIKIKSKLSGGEQSNINFHMKHCHRK